MNYQNNGLEKNDIDFNYKKLRDGYKEDNYFSSFKQEKKLDEYIDYQKLQNDYIGKKYQILRNILEKQYPSKQIQCLHNKYFTTMDYIENRIRLRFDDMDILTSISFG